MHTAALATYLECIARAFSVFLTHCLTLSLSYWLHGRFNAPYCPVNTLSTMHAYMFFCAVHSPY